MDEDIRQYICPNQELYTTRRYIHRGCSEGKDAALCVTRFSGGWKWYCHRCSKRGVVKLDGVSPVILKEAINALKRLPDKRNKGVFIPSDFTKQIPDGGLAWLWKFRISEYDIERFGIGYSKKYHRVILPVYQDDELVYWQGRWFEKDRPKDQPKYLNIKADRAGIYFKVSDHPWSKRVVLVEDVLSTINVSRVANCWGLLYASVTDALIIELAKQYDEILIWLDPDKSYYTVRRLKRYRQLGYPVKRLFTEKDPKYYSTKEIREHLS